MRLACFIAVFLTILFGSLEAQTIKVLNSRTNNGIKYVAVFSPDKKIKGLTDRRGRFDISMFKETDTLCFQHASFRDKKIPYSKLKSLKFKVLLDEKLIDLSEIVISANKWEQKKSEVPNKITAIGNKKIEFYNPQTSADLLGASNEVFVQKSQMGGGSPMIRGFAANSVLLVIDGVRMNNAIYRSGNLQNVITIDPNIIENAEVIFGPGSIIYGSDALGGVMDFHTKKVRLNSEDDKKFSYNLMSRFATANLEKSFHFDITHHGSVWGFLTSLTVSDYEDLRQGAYGRPEFDRPDYIKVENAVDRLITGSNPNVQNGSAYNQLNFLQKFRFRPNDNLDMNYTFSVSTSTDIPRYDRLIQTKNDQLRYSEWYYGPQFWLFNLLNIKLQKPNNFYNAAQLNLAYQNIEESRYSRKFGTDKLKSQIENVDVFSLNFDFDKPVGRKSTLFYGVEMLYNEVQSNAYNKYLLDQSTEPIATRYPDGGSKYYSYALYASFKTNLSEKFTLIGGARYSYLKLNSKFVDKTFFNFPYDKIVIDKSSFIGSFGLVYRPSESAQINLNAANGFRAPNLDDVAKIFDSTPGNIIMPNENLKEEQAYNFDLGYIQKIGETAKLNTVIFYTYLDDAMIRQDHTFNGQTHIMYDGELSRVQAIVNAGSANIYGGSLSLELLLSQSLKLHTTHSVTFGSDSNDEPIRHVAPAFGNLGLTYEKNDFILDFYINYNGEISFDNLASSEKDKAYLYSIDASGNPFSPAWYTLNLKSSYKLNRYLRLNFGLENIFDKRYRPYSSGISASGRNFYCALRMKF